MKFSFLSRQSAPVRYPGALFRFPIALIVAVFLVVYGEPETLLEFLQLPFFYDSLWGSLFITLVISEYIYICTKWLDFRYSWLGAFKKRIGIQFLICVIVPAALDYFLAGHYFGYHDKAVNMVEYLTYDFTVVVCFILLLNSYYLIVYLFKVRITEPKRKLPSLKPSASMTTSKTVAVIFAKDKASFAYAFDGEKMVWDKTLKESLNYLDATNYFLINRSEIIHRDSIESYTPGDSRTLKVVLTIPLKEESEFLVSQRRVVAFKRWYNYGL